MKDAYGTLFKTEAVSKAAGAKEYWGKLQKSTRDNTHIYETCMWNIVPWYSERKKSKVSYSINKMIEHPRVVLICKIMEKNKVLCRILIFFIALKYTWCDDTAKIFDADQLAREEILRSLAKMKKKTCRWKTIHNPGSWILQCVFNIDKR